MKLLLALPLLLARSLWAANIPAGTELQLRLTSDVTSDKPSGQPVEAVVIAPVYLDGTPALPAGLRVHGSTADAQPFKQASDGSSETPASLRLGLTQILDVGGQAHPLSCVLSGVDNARESIDSSGLIRGIEASQTYGAQIEKGISKLETKHGGLADLLSTVKSSIIKNVDPSITYKAGVEFACKLTAPLDWQPKSEAPPVSAVTPADALAKLVNAEPFRTVAQSPPLPSDLTNLMFIGSAEQVQAAFREAGWYVADALSGASRLETARALIENRGYNEAPMSVLNLDGRPPDLALQKQNNTFAMRHHIRIWQRPDRFNGKPVWVAAATHDIKITFYPENKSFTHGIDPNIDAERSKVVNDLIFTRTVHALALVDRSNIPPNLSNATGDHLQTDGKMAVLEF